ncbi:MAG TPA: hypothetical protein VFA09_15680 [Ktedonobacteraceae bacterium]|jgi:hypothetical protein|nr:hypothetical protein [Ktedonobacteraceae bacterium]
MYLQSFSVLHEGTENTVTVIENRCSGSAFTPSHLLRKQRHKKTTSTFLVAGSLDEEQALFCRDGPVFPPQGSECHRIVSNKNSWLFVGNVKIAGNALYYMPLM